MCTLVIPHQPRVSYLFCSFLTLWTLCFVIPHLKSIIRLSVFHFLSLFRSAWTFTPSDTSGINLSFNLLTVHRTFASFSAHFLINLSFFLVLLERPPYPLPLFPFSNLSLPLFLASPKGAKVGITFSWPIFLSFHLAHVYLVSLVLMYQIGV